MASYTAPGVYVQDISSGSQSISQASSSVGLLIGQTRSGVIGTPIKVGSWTEFIEKFANGLDTPFMEDSYLPYAAHGFFLNGGKELYILNMKNTTDETNPARKATVTTTTNKLTLTAISEGEWGNDISVEVKKSASWTADNKLFDVVISVGTSDSVTITETTLETIVADINASTKAKKWIGEVKIDSSTAELTAETSTLAGGAEGVALTDQEYIDALEIVSEVDDVTLIGIPGQTSSAVNSALMAYCDANWKFPFLDLPFGTSMEEAKVYRKGVTAWTGALCHPWGKVFDALTGGHKFVPTCGHMMGLYARTIENRGVHKAPAGTEAQVRGFVEMEYKITPTQLGDLNKVGVICIMSRPNTGIVAWGARSLNSTDTTLRYVSDGLLNLTIKTSLYNGTQFAVFEPNDERLWKRVESTCKAFLETLRLSGALKGTADEAYYVIVDDSNNTDDTINAGELNIEIGYAPVKPAEFVIIKLAHSIDSAE